MSEALDTEKRRTQGSVCLTVRANEVDPYQIAHHSNYAVWAELALQDYLRTTDNSVPPYRIRRFQCKYLQSALQDDRIEVNIRPAGTRDGASAFLFQVMNCAGRRILASGRLEIDA
ncbi:MAG: acyl-CoA thioesterase [Clostridia bacterium]|nr:acyl-CoA thioesterase [Clostridia bacterium]